MNPTPDTPVPSRNGADPETVGARVREARLRQKIGVRELARRVGVSASLISQVELGKASPSVGTLYAIVTQLGLSLDELLLGDSDSGRRAGGPARGPLAGRDGAPEILAGSEAVAGSAAVSGPGQAIAAEAVGERVDPVVRHGAGQAIQLASGVRWERLAPRTPQDIDFLRVRYEVDGASSPEDSLMRHAGFEYGHVITGRLGVTIMFDTYQLGPGDSIAFDSTTPHRLFNAGDAPVEAVWFVVGRDSHPRIARS